MALYDKGQEESELFLLSSDESGSNIDLDDLESHRKMKQANTSDSQPEYHRPMRLKFIWVGAYFSFSMALTLYNKFILGSVSTEGQRKGSHSLCMFTHHRTYSSKHPGS